jgi:diguanylate cyclase (GGDEF)-like protein
VLDAADAAADGRPAAQGRDGEPDEGAGRPAASAAPGRGPVEDVRLNELMDQIVLLAAGNLGVRLQPSSAEDSVDAAITGLNLLAEELESVHRTLEDRVAERTAQLDAAREQLERLALYDPLTGLANRTLLGDRMGRAVALAERGANPPCVLLLDLDEFKTINDGLGHGAGDQILVEVAHRLTSVVRDVDTVARLGGDEFAILLPGIDDDHALRIAERALAVLQEPFTVSDRAVWTGASIGVCFGTRGQDPQLILQDADTAMYAAKSEGRGRVQVFRPEMHHAARSRLQVASELGTAVELNQLRVEFQPISSLTTGAVVGAEALIRWQHPTRGRLIPGEFIAVAEDSGQIVEVGHWILRAAIQQLADWRSMLGDKPFRLHVNLSPVEVRWPGLAGFVAECLRRHDVPPEQLMLEIPESVLASGDVTGIESLVALRRLGVGVAIDDFGTGYSSISYLRRLPIDTVKVDPTIISDLAVDEAQVRFVGAILRLIEAAGLEAIVEGIETQAQLDLLAGMGCRYGQGYLLGRPVPAAAFALPPARPC